MQVSEPTPTPPEQYTSAVQQRVYRLLTDLKIPYQRVDCTPAITMEDCQLISQRLNNPVIKTLLLTNRQKTAFYLLVMPPNKPFITKDFGAALNISRVSFAPADLLLSMLGTPVGAASLLSLCMDEDNRVQLVIDQAAIQTESYSCSDTTTTSYIKLPTQALLTTYLNAIHHNYITINL